MPDITPTQVKVISGAVDTVTIDENVTVLGSLLTRDYSTGNYVLADAITAGLNVIHYMAVETGAAAGQIPVVRPGAVLDLGVVLLGATFYYNLSATPNAGRIAPSADLATTNYLSQAGIAETTSIFRFIVNNTGLIVP